VSQQRGARPVRAGVTSHDVAADAGVSQATVARVFRSPEQVAAPTRSKVEAAAARLGYVPNAIARSLKQQRTDIVGAVVPAYGEYWQHVVTAFSRQLEVRGKHLLLFSFAEGGGVGDVLATVDQFRLDGLVLASANISPAQLGQMWGRGVPVVAFNQPAASGVAPSVSVDNEGGMRLLARHLADAGCASTLFVGGVRTASTDQQRYLGAAQELAESSIPCAYLEAGSFSYEAGYKAAQQVADLSTLPDALLVAGDELAFGIVDGLAAAGVDVPGDVMVTGFDGLPQASWAGYDLTTLVQPVDALVEQAVDLMLSTRPGSTDPIPDIVTAGALRFGASTHRSAGNDALDANTS